MKNNRKSDGYVEEEGLSKTNKEKENEAEEVIHEYKSSFNQIDLKDKSSTPKVKKDTLKRLNQRRKC